MNDIFFLSCIAVYIIMLAAIPCMHRQNWLIKPRHCYNCENAVNCFTSNGMKANLGNFQFMIVSPHDVTNKKPELLVDCVVLKSETSVKVLGITVDSRLYFSQYASNLYTKAARHLMSLLAFSGTSMKLLELWLQLLPSNNFCWIQNNEKLERIQERALRIVYGDYSSSYDQLLSQAKTPTSMVKRLCQLLYDTFKSTR